MDSIRASLEQGPWLYLEIDHWSCAIAQSQIHSLEENKIIAQYDDWVIHQRGWPVFYLNSELAPQPIQNKRFVIFLKNLPQPIGLYADQIQILSRQDLHSRTEPPPVWRSIPSLLALLVLTDKSIVPQIDGSLIALRLNQYEFNHDS